MITRRDVFQALADPARRSILSMISSNGPMSPGAIADNFDTSRQTVSKHIQILTECELLTYEQKGREIYYHFNAKKMKEVADFIEPFRNQWEKGFKEMDKLLVELKTKKK